MKQSTNDKLRVIGALIAVVGIMLDMLTTFGALAAIVFVVGGGLVAVTVFKEKWFYSFVVIFAVVYKTLIFVMLLFTGKIFGDNAILIALALSLIAALLRGIYMKSSRNRY